MSVTIRVKPGTRDFLRESSVKGETYDDVINRLIIDARAQDELRAWEAWVEAREEEESR